MSKKWYEYFVVTAPNGGVDDVNDAAPLRASDLVPDAGGDATFTTPLTPDADFSDIRRSWQGILERALRDRKACTVAEFMRVTWPAEAGPSTSWQTTTTTD